MRPPKSISVVIPTHNRVKSLKRLLHSISKSSLMPDEIILVNDGSKDGTKPFLEQWKSKNHEFLPIVFHNPRSLGPGAARNIGIQLASGDAIAFTDDDCILNPNWIYAIYSSNLWKEENIVGIGGKVLPVQKGLISEYFTFHRILEPPRYNQYLVTANACFLKKALELVGGFDEDHQYPGGEDNGLSFKLANKGYKFEYESKMMVYHDYRTSMFSFFRTFYRYGKGCAEIIRKYFSKESSRESKSRNKDLKFTKFIPHRINYEEEMIQ